MADSVSLTDATGRVRPLAEIETDAIRHAMAATDGNHSEAARLLGIGRTTLWRKLIEIRAARTVGAA